MSNTQVMKKDDQVMDQKDKSMETDGFWARLKASLADIGVLTLALLLFCFVVALIVHLFRLFHTGRYLISAISACSDVISSFAWPSLVIVLVILYRKCFQETANELPKYLRYYLQKAIHPAHGGDDDKTVLDDSSNQGASSLSYVSKSDSKGGWQNNDSKVFENFVLNLIQQEYGVLVMREVNLFSNKSHSFDGAMIWRDSIFGVEVCYGGTERYSRQLSRIEEFYKKLSSREQRYFGLIFCVRGEREETLSLLQRLRENLSYPVAFRVFQYDGQSKKTEDGSKS